VTTPGLEIDFAAAISASIDGLTAEMRADRRRKQDLAADVAYIETPPINFAATALPYTPGPGWGPNVGYNWAVQRITVGGFGATTDYLTAYRGTTTAHAGAGQNALYTFQEAVAGGVSTWHPGRTGLILKGQESLAFNGSITTGPFFVNIDVIQLTDAQLPYFLL
jgi:hypothetical protein